MTGNDVIVKLRSNAKYTLNDPKKPTKNMVWYRNQLILRSQRDSSKLATASEAVYIPAPPMKMIAHSEAFELIPLQSKANTMAIQIRNNFLYSTFFCFSQSAKAMPAFRNIEAA